MMAQLKAASAAIFRRLKRLWIISIGLIGGHPCPACGMRSVLISRPVLWPELIDEWGLSPEWVRHFDQREGDCCGFCRCSLRDRQLAEGLVEAFCAIAGSSVRSLKELCQHPIFKASRIAEINAAGSLHRFLKELPNLSYSEFGSTDRNVPSENLLALSYPDSCFDLVITSETLEHVPEIDMAFREIHRVLKPGGWHVFSVPVVWDRKRTRKRASVEKDKVIHHLNPSYHGASGVAASDFLVFYEFGSDFTEMCAAAGFEVRVLKDSRNPALATFLARKTDRQRDGPSYHDT